MGLEPTVSRVTAERFNQLNYTHHLIGSDSRTRTCNPLLNRELRYRITPCRNIGTEEGIRTLVPDSSDIWFSGPAQSATLPPRYSYAGSFYPHTGDEAFMNYVPFILRFIASLKRDENPVSPHSRNEASGFAPASQTTKELVGDSGLEPLTSCL